MKHFRLNLIRIQSCFIAFTLFGFYFISTLFETIGFSSSIPSYFYRSLIFTVAFIYLLVSKFKTDKFYLFITVLIYMLIYIFFSIRGYVHYDINYSVSIYFSVIFFMTTVVFPSVLFVNLNKLDFDLLSKVSSVLILLTFAFVVYSYKDFVTTNAISNIRLYSERVNPISLGHLAASLVIISIFQMFTKKNYSIYSIFCLFSGLLVLVLTQSRGAAVSLFCALFVFFVFSNYKNIFRYSIYSLIVLLIFTFIVFFFELNIYFDAYLKLGSTNDLSAQGRLNSYSGAIETINTYPFFGYGYEEPVTKYYPHNIILEALLNTGFFGFLYFLFIVFFVFLSLFRNFKKSILFNLFFIQYFTGAMFSGALWSSNVMWYMIVYVICNNYFFSKFSSKNKRASE